MLHPSTGALLVAVAFVGLGRLRSARFRAAPGGAPPAPRLEAAVFVALAAAGLASLVAHRGLAGAALEPASRAALAGAVAGWALATWRRAPRAGGVGELAGAGACLALALALGAAGALHAVEHVLTAAAGVLLLGFAGERADPRPARRASFPRSAFAAKRVLKADVFGRIEEGELATPAGTVRAVRRDFRAGPLWLRPLAAVLARREARALARLEGADGVPRLLDAGDGALLRSYVEGRPLPDAGTRDPAYFDAARGLLRRLHAVGLTHNDTHKPQNWLVTPEGRPALVDFQLAIRHAARTRWFRACAHEDVRHLLKHKRRFCPAALTARERALLERRLWVARAWMALGKPVYVLVTRRVLGWRDAEGRGVPR